MQYITNSWTYDLHTMVIDLNGTLTVGGMLDIAIVPLLKQLKEDGWTLCLLTGNQRWNADMFSKYGLDIVKVANAAEKEEYILSLDVDWCVAIGNARIDIGMFKHAKVSVATLQAEWIHTDILSHVDIIVPSMLNALELFIDPNRFAATMKV